MCTSFSTDAINATMMVCRPVLTTKASAIPPAFVLDSDGRKLFRSACRARAVAKDHTPETAYLLVPEDVEHGYLLRCSHPWCNKTGRLFRYCIVCCQPVTKRNFNERHGHGLIRRDEEGRSVFPIDNVVSTPRSTEDDRDENATTSRLDLRSPVPSASAIVSDEESTGLIACETKRSIEQILSVEEQKWLQLIRERPQSRPRDGLEMSQWLTSIRVSCYPEEEPAPMDEAEVGTLLEPIPWSLHIKNEAEEETTLADLDDFDLDLENVLEDGALDDYEDSDIDF